MTGGTAIVATAAIVAAAGAVKSLQLHQPLETLEKTDWIQIMHILHRCSHMMSGGNSRGRGVHQLIDGRREEVSKYLEKPRSKR